jgi:hypothetical protein
VKASVAEGYHSVSGLSGPLSAKRKKKIYLALRVRFRAPKLGKAKEKATLERPCLHGRQRESEKIGDR